MNTKHNDSSTLLLGGSSYIAKYLAELYMEKNIPCLATFRDHEKYFFDLEEPLKLKLEDKSFQYAIIFASMTGLGKCESEPQLSHNINVENTINLIKHLVKHKIVPIFLSTDCVFDGSQGNYVETSQVNPLMVYAKHKVLVEKALETITDQFLIIRLSKVYGLKKGDGTLIDEMAQKLLNGQSISVADDQIMSPILVTDVTNAILKLQNQSARGYFHVCSKESISRFEIACKVAQKLGVNAKLVKKISLKQLEEKFVRPLNTSMSCEKLLSNIDIQLNSIEESIDIVCSNYV